MNLELCHLFKEEGFEYKIPEEWFYTLYYCALAILAIGGIETRSQKCTALFLRYAKEKKLIEYDDELIDRISVRSEVSEKTDVDKREDSRYGSSIKSAEVVQRFDAMNALCKRAIGQAEEIVFSPNKYEIPSELRSLQ